MSDLSANLISSVNNAIFEGPDVTITECGLVGMVTIRGNFGSARFKKAVKSTTGLAVPEMRRFVKKADTGLGWMSPDELLLTCDYATAPSVVAALQKALGDEHALVINVSDARAVFRLEGAGARELIAKGAPVDMAPDAFGAGELRRSRLGQVAAAFWLGEDNAFTLVCFRSVGQYMFDWLSSSAKDGARPGLF